MEEAGLKRMILQKLVRASIWGGKHTPVDFVRKGVPEHYRNTHKGQKALANAGWVIVLLKKTGKGTDEHVSLNPRKVGEIKQFLENLNF
jgi:hypothetical protein